MPLSPDLEKKLAKKYEVVTRVDDTFRGLDISFMTDDNGNPVTLYIGKRNPDGSIHGERYARRLQYAPDGITILKSHWDLKGKVTR